MTIPAPAAAAAATGEGEEAKTEEDYQLSQALNLLKGLQIIQHDNDQS